MKVAIITNTCYEEIIPLSKYLSKNIIVDFYSVISSRGSGVSLLFEDSNFLNNKQYSVVECKKENISEIFQNYIDDEFSIFALYFKSLSYLNPVNLFTAFKISKIIKKSGYDLIHFNVITPLVFIIRMLLKDTPIVITIHDPIPHTGEENINKKINRFFIKRFLNLPIIFHSKYSLNLFTKKFQIINRSRLKYIPFGLHEWLLYYKKNVDKKENSILFFGRISPYKGVEYLLKASEIVKQSIDDLTVTIAGNGEFNFDISNYQNDKTFKIINRYISNEELSRLLLSHELVVCPYTDATQSGVIMTAFTFSKPIVATDVGGIPEVIVNNETGFLVPPRNINKLSEVIINILRNKEKIKAVSRNIDQKYLNQGAISWDKIAQQTLDVYKECINNA